MTLEREAWRAIPGFDGKYEASNLGRVRSLHRRSAFVLKPDVRPDGHLQVAPSVRSVQQTCLVHYLVLLAFVGTRPDGADIRHLNGDPADNQLANLRYGTRSQNKFDDVLHGKHNNARKTHCPSGHEYTEANVYRPPSRPNVRHCRTCSSERERPKSHAHRLPVRTDR